MATIEEYFNGNHKDCEGEVVNPLSPLRPMKALQTITHELIEGGTELTVTFKEELHRAWGENMLKEILEKVLTKTLKKQTHYTLVLIGEHSPVGRFHYHGFFRGLANDAVAKLKRSLQRHIGRTEIKMITYTESYAEYIFKSYTTYPGETWGWHSYIKLINT